MRIIIHSIIVLKITDNYTLNEAEIPVGGKLRFGITATTVALR
jgi:hypothetical protein